MTHVGVGERRRRLMLVNVEALVTIRLRSGLSIRQLAKRSGLSPAAISRIENGLREAEPATILALAKGLDVPLVTIIQ
jgi:transcriptional regulator with XRE-family HTH domain